MVLSSCAARVGVFASSAPPSVGVRCRLSWSVEAAIVAVCRAGNRATASQVTQLVEESSTTSGGKDGYVSLHGSKADASNIRLSVQRCTAALRSWAGARAWEQAVALLAEMRASAAAGHGGPVPDTMCYNATLGACAKAAAADMALLILREMPKEGLHPNTITYNSTITACGRSKRWETSLALLTEMRLQCIGASTVTYGAVVSACEKASSWAAAIAVLSEAHQRTLQPNLLVYSAAISACGKGFRWNMALQLLQDAREQWPRLDSITCCCAIVACSRGSGLDGTDAGGGWEWCLVLLGNMRAIGLQPDKRTVGAVAASCRAMGRWKQSFALLASVSSSLTESASDPDMLSFAISSGNAVTVEDCGSTEVASPEVFSCRPQQQREQQKQDSYTLLSRGRADGHAPVLQEPAIQELLNATAGGVDGTYVDCTFGRGGHTQALLERLSSVARVFTFDVDPTAVAEARRLAACDPRLQVIHRPFGDLAVALPSGVNISGILADLGVSSPQLDQRHRGFSVLEDGPLDLRMNPRVGVPASQWLADASTEELAWVIREYGEDDDPLVAARIAEGIKAAFRTQKPLRRTRQLSDLVTAIKTGGASNNFQQPARLTFQALRTHLNQEFQQLDELLKAAFKRLAFGGRVVIICFKHAEVAAVRRFIRDHEECDPRLLAEWPPERLLQLYPLLARRPSVGEEHPSAEEWCVAEVGPPLQPSTDEVQFNTRARSANALVLEKRARRVDASKLVASVASSTNSWKETLFRRPKQPK
eukprot:TRINITY_DN57571_c0_g1_i1.p1 TRINITY_DN57571_c0_g1~~TRINITY_DN57571_c0_g1_i1.p1  ORF type:complete len:765 (-),score=109.96 TRINITY_DN57571_c0_g1_i1:89-2383(-)